MAEKYALIPESATMYTQTDVMKESKDLSQNLVSGDFEMQYRNRIMDHKDPRRRKNWWLMSVVIAIGALFAWLLVITILQEVHVARLRNEVELLSAHIVAVEASLKGLDQKVSNNKLFTDLEEDTIYTDDGHDLGAKTFGDKADYSTLEKLHRLTVLEDDTMPDDVSDDEDLYEDTEEESGDYYQDYNRRTDKKKIGTTNMVTLTPEDFTDHIVQFSQEDKNPLSKFRKIQQMLNENPENPDIGTAFASSILEPEVPEEPNTDRDKRSVMPDISADMVDEFAAPRLSVKAEERRKTKKFVPSGESASPSKLSLHSVSRSARNSDNEGQNQLIAAHFHGNTSGLNTEIHEHYKGNGLVRVAHDQAHNVWYPSRWTMQTPHPRPALTKNGHVHVRTTGVYFVYVQIYYLDSHDIISWVLHRTNADTDGRETLLQCAQSSHSAERMDKPNSCYSAAALFLRAGDRLAVRNTGGDRHSLMEPEKSFIGLVKLGDAFDPSEELI